MQSSVLYERGEWAAKQKDVNCFQYHIESNLKANLMLSIDIRPCSRKLLIKEKEIASHTLHRNYNIHHCPLFCRPVELEQLFPLPNFQQ